MSGGGGVLGVSDLDDWLYRGVLNRKNRVYPLPVKVTDSTPPDPFWSGKMGLEIPIVIDFGSYFTRAGFATQPDPFLEFPSVYTRCRLGGAITSEMFRSCDEDENGNTIVVGNDTLQLPFGTRKISPFDLNVPYNFDGVEYVMDHVFLHLLSHNRPPGPSNAEDYDVEDYDSLKDGNSGGNTRYYDGSIEHPLLMSEAPYMPKHFRSQILQLVYECYMAPSFCLGIDALFSLLYDHQLNYRGSRVTDSFEEDVMIGCGVEGAKVGNRSFGCGVDGHVKSSFFMKDMGSFSLFESDMRGGGECQLNSMSFSSGFDDGMGVPTMGGDDGGRSGAKFDWIVGERGLEDRFLPFFDSSNFEYPEMAIVVSCGFEVTHVLPICDGVLDSENVLRLSIGGHHATELLNQSVQLRYRQHRGVWGRMMPNSGVSLGYGVSEAIKEQHGVMSLDYLRSLKELESESFIVQSNGGASWGAGIASNSPFLPDIDCSTGDEDSLIRYIQLPFEPMKIKVFSEEERIELASKRVQNIQKFRRKGEDIAGSVEERQFRLGKLKKLFEMRSGVEGGELSENWKKTVIECGFHQNDLKDACTGNSKDRVTMKVNELKKSLLSEGSDAGTMMVEDWNEMDEEALMGKKFPKSRSQIHTDVSVLTNTRELMYMSLDELKERRGMLRQKLSELRDWIGELEMRLDEATGSLGKHQLSTGGGSGSSNISLRSSHSTRSRLNFIVEQQKINDNEQDMQFLENKFNGNTKFEKMKGELEKGNRRLREVQEFLEVLEDEILSRLDPSLLRRKEAEKHQISIGVDRIRGSELIFQPSIVGNDQQGLIEMIISVLNRYKRIQPDEGMHPVDRDSEMSNLRLKMLKYVYLTGGNANWKTFSSRVFTSLAQNLPAEWVAERKIRVIQSSHPSIAAWRGAALFAANEHNQQKFFVPRYLYEEEGPDRVQNRFMTHFAANKCLI